MSETGGITTLTSGSSLVLGYIPTDFARDGHVAPWLTAIGETLTEVTKISERKVQDQHWIDTAEGYPLDLIGLGLANTKRFTDNTTQYRRRIKATMAFEGGGNLNTMTGLTEMEYNTGSWFAWYSLRQTCNDPQLECNKMGRCFDESGRATLIEWIYPSGQSFGSTAERLNQNVEQFKALGVMYNGFGETLPSNMDIGGGLTGGWYYHGSPIHAVTVSTCSTGDTYSRGGSSTQLNFTSVSYGDTGEITITKDFGTTYNLLESGHSTFNFQLAGNNTDLKLKSCRVFSNMTRISQDYRYSMDLSLEEDQGVARTSEIVTVSVSGITVGHCYYDSVRLYTTDTGGTETTHQIHNKVMHCNATEWTWEDSVVWDDKPDNWTNGSMGSGTVLLLPHYQGFKRVARITDTAAGANYVLLYHAFASAHFDDNHAYEAWIRFEGSDPASGITNQFGVYNSALAMVASVGLDSSGNLVDHDGNTISASISKNVWHHIKIVVNFTSNTSTFYLDFATSPTATGDANGKSDIEYLLFGTGNGDQAASSPFFVAYVDHYANGGSCQNCYIEDFDLTFLATVNASSSKTYRIYFDPDSQGDPGYAGIARAANQVTCSDNTQYNFKVGQFDFEDVTWLDKNGVDWCTFATYYNYHYGWEFAGNVSPIWLEDGPIFVENVYYENSGEYIFHRIHDNNMVKETFKTVATNAIAPLHSFGTATFVEHLRYYAGAWLADAVGSGDFDRTLTLGKAFWDDTDDLQVVDVFLHDWTGNGLKTRVFTPLANRVQFGFAYDTLGNTYLQANTEYVFWQGLRDAGASDVGTKQTFVDNLYTEVISNPLTQTLGSEDEIHDTITHNGWLGYSSDESGSVLTGVSFTMPYQFRCALMNYDKTDTGGAFNVASVSGASWTFYGASGDTIDLYFDALHFGKIYSSTGVLM